MTHSTELNQMYLIRLDKARTYSHLTFYQIQNIKQHVCEIGQYQYFFKVTNKKAYVRCIIISIRLDVIFNLHVSLKWIDLFKCGFLKS